MVEITTASAFAATTPGVALGLGVAAVVDGQYLVAGFVLVWGAVPMGLLVQNVRAHDRIKD